MAVAGMLALSSCSNDDNEPIAQNAPQQMTFTAGFGDDGLTRASLYDNMKKVKFDAGDQISILSANNNNVKFTTTAGGATASFDGTAVAGDPTYYAIYPYTDGLNLSSTTITGVKIPKTQSAAASSSCGWDPDAPIAYATSTDGTSLTFHNLCALLKVTNDVGGDITIQIHSSKELSGTFNLDTSTGVLDYQSTYGEVDVSGVPNGKTIYIAIAPGEKTDFYAYRISGTNIFYKNKSSVTFEAGKIYDLGNTSSWTDEFIFPFP